MLILDNAFIGTHFQASALDPHGLLRDYEEGLKAQIFEKLWEFYPGYNWGVRIDAANGWAQVQIGSLMRSTYGEVILLEDLATDPGLLAIKRAGGKVLEVLRLRRQRADRDAVKSLKAQTGSIFPFAAPIAGMEKPKPKVSFRPATETEARAMLDVANGKSSQPLLIAA